MTGIEQYPSAVAILIIVVAISIIVAIWRRVPLFAEYVSDKVQLRFQLGRKDD